LFLFVHDPCKTLSLSAFNKELLNFHYTLHDQLRGLETPAIFVARGIIEVMTQPRLGSVFLGEHIA